MKEGRELLSYIGQERHKAVMGANPTLRPTGSNRRILQVPEKQMTFLALNSVPSVLSCRSSA